MSSGVGGAPLGDRERVVSLRSLAHPVRLRILSLLTGAAMSAAEVARELDLTHANASYHLRQLVAAGQLVEAGEEVIRGGRAKRYRYDLTAPGVAAQDADQRAAWFRLLAAELVRRSASVLPEGRQHSTDAELWVPSETWRRALERLTEISTELHASALPPRSPGTVHASVTLSMFAMAGGEPR
jgi:DNA-binding transcriptional ArsR family regulator